MQSFLEAMRLFAGSPVWSRATRLRPYGTTWATFLPRVLHGLGEFRQRQCVQYVLLREPGAAGLQYPEANFVQVRGVVRICIDHDLDPVLFRQPEMTIVEVKAIGIGIQFHGHLLSRGSFQHGLNI